MLWYIQQQACKHILNWGNILRINLDENIIIKLNEIDWKYMKNHHDHHRINVCNVLVKHLRWNNQQKSIPYKMTLCARFNLHKILWTDFLFTFQCHDMSESFDVEPGRNFIDPEKATAQKHRRNREYTSFPFFLSLVFADSTSTNREKKILI